MVLNNLEHMEFIANTATYSDKCLIDSVFLAIILFVIVLITQLLDSG